MQRTLRVLTVVLSNTLIEVEPKTELLSADVSVQSLTRPLELFFVVYNLS